MIGQYVKFELSLSKYRLSFAGTKDYECPSTLWGRYTSSSASNSSSLSVISVAFTASSRCCILLAPIIGAGDSRLLQHPGERDLRVRYAPLPRDLRHAIHHFEIRIVVVHLLRVFVGLGARGVAAVIFLAADCRPGSRAPADSTESCRCPLPGIAESSLVLLRDRSGCSGSAS